MIAVDTNVLVRILVDDAGQPAQVAAARRLASQAKRVFVPLVVQVELVWVLESGYRLDKDTVTGVLQRLEVNHAFALEDDALCRNALTLYGSSNADYADCVILERCRAGGLPLHTFDKRLGRLAGALMADDPKSNPATDS